MPQIKVLNNLLLAINYSRIFVGCFVFALIHELLNKSINLSKVFSLSYVIQFTRYRHARFEVFCFAANFYMLAHLFHFVKNFFRFFSKFLLCCCRAPGSRRSSRNFYMLPQIISFVKNFFHFFSNFLISAYFLPPLRTASIY